MNILASHEKLLIRDKRKLLPDYKISYLELAKDIICKDKLDSEILREKIIKHTRIKYKNKIFIYDQSKDTRKSDNKKSKIINLEDDYSVIDKENKKEALYSERTGYWGGDMFKFVAYARLSKFGVSKPCLHAEFRIRRSGNIKNKTGIVTLKDLSNTVSKKTFNKLIKKFITFEEINYEKLGKWVNGIPPTVNTIKIYGSIKFNTAKRIGHIFCRFNLYYNKDIDSERYYFGEEHSNDQEFTYEVITAQRLRQLLKRKRIENKKRRLNVFEKKVLNLTPYRVETFFKNIEIEHTLI